MAASPSKLAQLPEVTANGGFVPARLIDIFSARTIYASQVDGVKLDCDLDARSKVGGGSPTDNAAALNAILATASSANPLHLVIDGGCAIGAALEVPVGGHVRISGQGWGTGIYILPGSTCMGIQTADVGTTDLQHYQSVAIPNTPTTIVGSNVEIMGMKLDFNRGTYPDGNVDGHRDGTMTMFDSDTPDARGPYPDNGGWLNGIYLKGIENVLVEDCWLYDSPSYHAAFAQCHKVRVLGCRIESGDLTLGSNTDGVHFFGGCADALVDGCWISTGDDGVAWNLNELDGIDGSDFTFSNSTCFNSVTMGRVMGTSDVHRVRISNVVGINIQAWGFSVGGGGLTTSADGLHSVVIEGVVASIVGMTTGPLANAGCLAILCDNAGLIELRGCKMIEPATALPMVRIVPFATPTISSLRMIDCGIHRNSSGDAAAYALEASQPGTTIGDLVIDGFHVTDHAGSSASDIPALINIAGTSVASMSLDARVKGVATVVNIDSSGAAGGVGVGSLSIKDLDHTSNAGSPTAHSFVAAGSTVPISVGRYSGSNLAGIATGTVSLSGPGLLPSGFAVADSIVADNSPYLGSGHSGAPCIKVAGTAKTINLT